MLSFQLTHIKYSTKDIKLFLNHYRKFTKYRKIRYRRIYGDAAKGEPRAMSPTRAKMFVPTHIAHKHDWSPVERIWSQRASKHDHIDHVSLTSLIKETTSSIDLLDVIGLSLRKHKRHLEWKPYHSCVALHHLAEINNGIITTNDTALNNRYLWDLIEECAVSVTLLKPRFIAQTMWSLNKLGLTQTSRGKLCLLKCANSLNANPLLHKLEIWNVSDIINVLTKNKMYNHSIIGKICDRIISMYRDNEWFSINDIGQSYSILSYSFGKIIQYRNINNENGDEDNIDYISLCYALIDRFMNDKIYKASNNFEILNFIKGIGNIMKYCNNKLEYNKSINKLEVDLYENIQSMHVKDIAIITNVFVTMFDKNVLFNKSVWFKDGDIIKYMKNLIDNDGFTLMDINESSECLYYFVQILVNIMENNGKNSEYYPLYDSYMSEVIRVMDMFNEYCERYQDEQEEIVNLDAFDYNKCIEVMNWLIKIFDGFDGLNLKDKNYFLFEQKFLEILCGFLQSETRLYAQIEWKRLLSLECNIDLLNVLLRGESDSKGININALKAIFLSLEYHILDGNNYELNRDIIANDINESRHLINKLYNIIGFFYTFQCENEQLFMDENGEETKQLISNELREYFMNILLDEYNNKFHILTQKDRKNVLRTLLILGEYYKNDNNKMNELITDFNRFEFYKGTREALLTQIIDDKTEINGHVFGENIIKSDLFKRFLSENGLFISLAYVLTESNVFQIKNLNEWRFQRLEKHKMIQSEEWCEDGAVRGPLFEWRKGGVREGAGLHPTLNDIDFIEKDVNVYDNENNRPNSDIEDEKDIEIEFDYDYAYEDNVLLTQTGDINYKRIILRNICDLLLESYDNKNEMIAIFVNINRSKKYQIYYQYLCDLFDVKCVVIDDIALLNDAETFCKHVL